MVIQGHDKRSTSTAYIYGWCGERYSFQRWRGYCALLCQMAKTKINIPSAWVDISLAAGDEQRNRCGLNSWAGPQTKLVKTGTLFWHPDLSHSLIIRAGLFRASAPSVECCSLQEPLAACPLSVKRSRRGFLSDLTSVRWSSMIR